MGEFLEFEKPLLRIQHDVGEMEREQRESARDLGADIKQQRARFKATMKRLYSKLTPWETVLVARHPRRPHTTDYLRMVFRDFCELHGDRAFGDDKAILTGFARIGGHRVMLIGHNKGKDIKERVACNFGCAHPEGYRKALQKMKLAEKYGLPIVCLIDTQGAYPGIGAEERGQAEAIANNLREMAKLKVPVLVTVTGEGGSGGALAVGVGNQVNILEFAIYSVISPEGCAAILWRDTAKSREAAEALKLTAPDLHKLDLVDEIIPEVTGGAHVDPARQAVLIGDVLERQLGELEQQGGEELVRLRFDRFRRMGVFQIA